MFVIKLQLSKISVKTSKGHKYFEEFTLWILIKHILIFNIHSRIKSFFPASLINWAGYAQHIFESNMYGHFIPIDILPYGHFQIHQIFMDISLLWTICHMVFLHIDLCSKPITVLLLEYCNSAEQQHQAADPSVRSLLCCIVRLEQSFHTG